jgi:hypothetical protein
MAKQPTIKFPRIQAGFYNVTLDGELVGYVMSEKDGKEVNWYVFDNSTPDLPMDVFVPENAIDAPDSLFREAKESAKNYFMNRPMSDEDIEVLNLPEADWEILKDGEAEDSWEENTIVLEMDENGEEFEPALEDATPELELAEV